MMEKDTMNKAGMRVLIADSSPFIVIMLTTVLEKLGFEVVGTAKEGKEAIDKYMKLKPDVMLVDAELKDLEGIEATRIIETENSSSIVILMVAESSDTPDLIVKAVKAGIKGYLRKPFSAEENEARIGGVLKKS
ncbi:Chemotaxis protein CheY [subsurface metagenome]|nr:response regulator [Methanosarcinales archaeon]